MAQSKSRKGWERRKYDGKLRTAPSIERIHLEKVKAGKKSHKK